MGLTMKERNSVTKETAVRYRNAKKKEKKQILDEYVKLTGFARKYAIAKLNSCIHKREHEYNNVTIKTVKVELPKKKKRIYVPKYGKDTVNSLNKIWRTILFYLSNFLLKKNLKTFSICRNGKEVVGKVCEISRIFSTTSFFV